MEIFSNKNQCCGCTACKSICPKNAISMQVDNEGFLYPIINKELCINCGLCKKVCAFQNGYTRNSVVNAYAVKHHDIKLGSQAEAAVHSFPYLTILFRITVQFMVPRLMKIFRLVILELKVVLKEIE